MVEWLTPASCDEKFDEHAFLQLVSVLSMEKSKVWTASDIYDLYKEYGSTLKHRSLLSNLEEHYQGDLVVFWSYGLSSIVVFRTSASGVIKLVDDSSSDSSDSVLKTASKQIMQECKGFSPKSSTYQTCIDKGIAAGVVSPTLSTLLQNLTKNQENCLPRIMIGNVISNAITSHLTALQIALEAYLGKKHLIEQFHSLGVCCSYDEVLRFKDSTAKFAANDLSAAGLSQATDGLVQVIVDNFDANISSLNCLASTHALAMILTQSPDKPGSILVLLNEETSIPRIRREDMRKPIDDTPVSVYYSLKKPPMPDAASRKAVLPLKVLAQQVTLDQRTKELDFAFLKSIGSNPHTPEFGGFNTKMA